MKVVYKLSRRLREDPRLIELAQALTLNATKPHMGLRGTHGLYGSDVWWSNIHKGTVPLQFVSGIIQRAYCAGQDRGNLNNTIDVRLDDGTIEELPIYVHRKKDVALFQPGREVMLVCALEELKSQPGPDGNTNYSRVALEMAVSA